MAPRASCKMECASAIFKACITPSHIIAGAYDGTILLLDVVCAHQNLNNDPHMRLIQAGQMWDMDWHGSLLATGHHNGTVRLWNIETGLKLKEFVRDGDRIAKIKMPNNEIVITGTGENTHAIRVWDIVSGLCLYAFHGHTGSITSIDVLDDLLISGSYDQTVRIHDLAAGKELSRLEGHAEYPHIFGYNEDRTFMAVACSGGDIKLWRLIDSTCIGVCQGHTRVVVRLENRRGSLVSASADGGVRIWDWKDGSLISALDPAHQSSLGHLNAVRGMVFTARYMITGGFRDGLLKVWDQGSNVLLSEHEVGEGVWNITGGEGRLVACVKLKDGPHKIILWNQATIDSEGI